MASFFEQMCKVIAESEGSRGKISSASPDLQKFFSDIPKAVVESSTAVVEQYPAVPEAVPEVSGSGQMPSTLDELRNAVANCQNCPLCRTRNNTVFGEGDPNARLMFIGEGPGADEDRQGRPFVGKAGMLLDKMINAMQFSREEVYIANIVKCRPPDNRLPAPEEAEKCIGYLRQQIGIVRPEVIVLLGATAVKYLLNVTNGISRMRGRWLSYENIPVMATYHPAFLLRQESAKRDTWNDLQQVMARFGKYHRRSS